MNVTETQLGFDIGDEIILLFSSDEIPRARSSERIIIKTKCSKLARYQGHGATKGAVSELISDDFEADVSGASSLLLQKGTIGQLKASASGASSIDAKNAEATVAKATATGASKIVLSVSDKLMAKSSGASTIIYLGSPISLDKASSGASSVAQVK